MAIIIQWSKTVLSPLSPPRTPVLYRGFGAVGIFRPLQSSPDQARHLPEAPVPQPRKSVQLHTWGVPCAASLARLAIYTHTPDISLRYNGVSLISHFWPIQGQRKIYRPTVFQKIVRDLTGSDCWQNSVWKISRTPQNNPKLSCASLSVICFS